MFGTSSCEATSFDRFIEQAKWRIIAGRTVMFVYTLEAPLRPSLNRVVIIDKPQTAFTLKNEVL